jgi:hypothetical protein
MVRHQPNVLRGAPCPERRGSVRLQTCALTLCGRMRRYPAVPPPDNLLVS